MFIPFVPGMFISCIQRIIVLHFALLGSIVWKFGHQHGQDRVISRHSLAIFFFFNQSDPRIRNTCPYRMKYTDFLLHTIWMWLMLFHSILQRYSAKCTWNYFLTVSSSSSFFLLLQELRNPNYEMINKLLKITCSQICA